MSAAANSFDVAIIGGGHNGLVAAALLSKAGRRVVLCEALPTLGGATGVSTLMPGMRVPQCAHVVSGFSPALIRKLNLRKHGLNVLQKNVARVALDADGRHIVFGSKAKATRENIFNWSSRDAESWKKFSGELHLLTSALVPLHRGVAPELLPATWQERMAWARHYLRMRRHGRERFQNLLQLLPSNVSDILDDFFETDILKGALALDASLGSYHGPSAPGSLFYWAWQRAAELVSSSGTLQVEGGPVALVQALASAARANGADIRTSSAVASIRIEGEKTNGLVLTNGDEIDASVVISTINPKTTYLDLVGARHLDAGMARDIDAIRMRASAAKVNLALGQLPSFAKSDEDLLAGRLLVAPGLAEVERASNPQKYGDMPAYPVMEVTLPSIADESLTPEGRHVLSAIVPFVPLQVAGGWEGQRDSLIKRVIKTLGEYAPDLPDLVMAAEVLTPKDLETQLGVAGGDWHQGEVTFDQAMMMRPVPQLTNGTGPVRGLFLGGAGAHPGGGLSGRPAVNAVAAATEYAKRGRS
ncbi:MAG: NAD(P)/FAD-dependent oxidoreductase [Pseudomonadota bacterium]